MAFLESHHCERKVAARQTLGLRACCFFIVGLTASLTTSNAFACYGAVDSDLLTINVQSLTGLSVQQLILMPSVQNYYVNGQLKAKFGSTVRPCSGPTCNEVPVGDRSLGKISIIEDASVFGALMTTSAEQVGTDELSRKLRQPAGEVFELFFEQPNLRPPIL